LWVVSKAALKTTSPWLFQVRVAVTTLAVTKWPPPGIGSPGLAIGMIVPPV